MISNNPHAPEVEEAHVLSPDADAVIEEHTVCNGCVERATLLAQAMEVNQMQAETIDKLQKIADDAIANCENILTAIGEINANGSGCQETT